MMDSLLCNELCPSYNEVDDCHNVQENNEIGGHVFSTKEDCEEALINSLMKEANYMPEKGYLEFVKTNHTILNARFKAVNWLVKSQRRMNLSPGTVFLAANYLDRFISLTRCQDWNCWMFELLRVACLTIATKFNETTTWTLHEFQVEGVDNCFAPTLIQRMELRVLKALAWRMDSTTPFSYIHIFTQYINDALNKTLIHHDFTNRVTQLLLSALLDPEFLEFRQCVVSMSAVRCVFEASTSNGLVDDTRIPNDQRDNLVKCERMMGQLLMHENDRHVPPSPVTVLKVKWFNFYDYNYYTSFLHTSKRKRSKRKRGELECGM